MSRKDKFEIEDKQTDGQPNCSGMDRRGFLVSTASAGAGLVLSQKAMAETPPAEQPVEEAAEYGGRLTLGRSIGTRVGLACVSDGRVFTEIEAIDTLFGLEAVHFASGGYGGSEGAVTLIVEGKDEDVHRCLDFIEKIKGEPPLPAIKGPCKTCGMLCSFQGKDVEELPPYLQ